MHNLTEYDFHQCIGHLSTCKEERVEKNHYKLKQKNGMPSLWNIGKWNNHLWLIHTRLKEIPIRNQYILRSRQEIHKWTKDLTWQALYSDLNSGVDNKDVN